MAVTKAYGGRVLIRFDEVKHYYTVDVPKHADGLFQPSVTGVIGKLDKSNALMTWAIEMMAEKLRRLLKTAPAELPTEVFMAAIDSAKNNWRDKRDQAATIGTLAHNTLEAILLGESIKTPLKEAEGFSQDMLDMANNSIDAGLQYIREHKIQVIEAEAPRWSPTYGYIGTGDLIAFVDRKRSVLDWKTSKRLYPTVKLQLTAYQQAWQEEHPDQPIEQRVAVNIGRDGELSVEKADNSTFGVDLEAFLSLLNVWHWDRENAGKYSKPPLKRLTSAQIAYVLAA